MFQNPHYQPPRLSSCTLMGHSYCSLRSTVTTEDLRHSLRLIMVSLKCGCAMASGTALKDGEDTFTSTRTMTGNKYYEQYYPPPQSTGMKEQ